MTHEYERRDGLSCVTRNPANTLVNVVFVHGLAGGAYSTWNSGNAVDLRFWPESVANEHPQCCIWTLHYTARVLEWNPFAHSRTIDLLDRAAWLVTLLVQENIASKPIVFVTHSLGGVLVKQALQFAQTLGPPRWRAVWERTHAVLFLATPHIGSQLASVATVLANALRSASPVTRLFFRPSRALRNLEKNNPTLRYLTDWYKNQAQVQGIETMAFAECRPYKSVIVVDESSASPQVANCVVVPLPEDDHISIAKPPDRNHPVYRGLSNCLDELEKLARTGTAPSILPPAPLDRAAMSRLAENRRLVARLCGDWWERIMLHDASAISFFQIQPDALSNSVSLGGKSYDKDGLHSATWDSMIARVGREGNKIRLRYVWEGRHTDPDLAKFPFHGFGEFEFDETADPTVKISCGSGRFWDVNEAHPEKTRVKPTELRRIEDKNTIHTMTAGTTKQKQSLANTTRDEW